MSKSKIRSMQRGAQKRSSGPQVRMQEIYSKHPPKIASADRPHLDFVQFGNPEQFAKISTVIKAAKMNRIGSASEICRLLNKLQIKTAIGDRWTPRLAWFVAANVRSAERKEGQTRTNQNNRFRGDAGFQDTVNKIVKSRLEEIGEDFEASKPTIGEASPELAEFKRRLQKKSFKGS